MKLSTSLTALVLEVCLASRIFQGAMAERNNDGLRELESKLTNLPDGIWTFRGYGWALNVANNGTDVNLLEETEISCIPNNMVLPYVDLDQAIVEDNGLVAYLTASSAILTNFTLEYSEFYQSGCANGITPNINNDNYTLDPLESFDILVETFSEHYAFFETRNLDWNALSLEARESMNVSVEGLWEAATNLLKKLDDPHVSITAGPDQSFRSKDTDETTTMLYEEFEQQDEVDQFEDYINIQLAKWRNIVATYMVDGKMLGGEPGGIVWGKFRSCEDVAEDIDFSGVRSVDDLWNELEGAWNDLGHCTPKNVGYIEVPTFETNDKTAYFEAIDTALKDLSDTDTLVLDTRFNPGGYDPWSIELASRFSRNPNLVHAFSKRAKYDYDSYTSWQKVYINPDDSPHTKYEGDVILITSGRTISAAETFTLAMAQLSQVTILGRQTIGAFSDQIQKILPVGWRFTVSNEEYATPDGTIYEVVGYPPDVQTETVLCSRADRANGIDSWLVEALAQAKGRAPIFSSASSPSDFGVIPFWTAAFVASVIVNWN